MWRGRLKGSSPFYSRAASRRIAACTPSTASLFPGLSFLRESGRDSRMPQDRTIAWHGRAGKTLFLFRKHTIPVVGQQQVTAREPRLAHPSLTYWDFPYRNPVIGRETIALPDGETERED